MRPSDRDLAVDSVTQYRKVEYASIKMGRDFLDNIFLNKYEKNLKICFFIYKLMVIQISYVFIIV
jgi:hypothetical protein